MLNGLFYLAGLGLIVWLGYWAAQEGRENPGKRRWSPFAYREDEPVTAAEPSLQPGAANWRQRTTDRPERSRRQ